MKNLLNKLPKTPSKSLLALGLMTLALFASFNASATVDPPGEGYCRRSSSQGYNVANGDRAILFYKPEEKADGGYYKGSFRLFNNSNGDNSWGDTGAGYLQLWTGYSEKNDPDGYYIDPNVIDDSQSIFAPDAYGVEKEWGYYVLIVIRSSVDADGQWYGQFSEGKNALVTAYLSFLNGAIGDVTYPDTDGGYTWEPAGSHEIFIPPGDWDIVAYPAYDAKITNCSYPEDRWPPLVPPEPEPEFEINTCDFFPEPIQSWNTTGTTFTSQSQSTITGWSQDYQDTNLINGELKVGFDTFNAGGGTTCDGATCLAGGGKLNADVVKIPEPEYTSTKALTIAGWSSQNQCDGGEYCTIVQDGDNITITIKKSLKSLAISAWDVSSKLKIIMQPDADDATYGLKIETFSMEGAEDNIDVVFEGAGRFTFNKITLNNGKISAQGNVLAIITESLTINNPILTGEGADGQFYIYGPEAAVEFKGYGQDMFVRILANSFKMSQGTIHGNITANTIDLLSYNTNIIGEPESCGIISQNVTLTMTPTKNYSLTCGTGEETSSTFTIDTKTSTGVNINLTDSDLFDIEIVDNQGSGSYPNYLSLGDGKLVLKVTPKSASAMDINKEYKITATSSVDSSKTATSTIKFVPYKFSLPKSYNDTLNVVAGYPTEVPLEVWACDATTDEPTIVTSYEGTPKVKQQVWISPSGGEGTLTYTPKKFSQGKSEGDKLTFDNSGFFLVTIEDTGFDCTDLEFNGCTNETKNTLQGIMFVQARPWAFSICDSEGNDLSSSGFFVHSGEEFELQLKPLVWKTGYGSANASSTIVQSDFCSSATVATNFYLDDAESSTVKLETESLSFPSGGILDKADEAYRKVEGSIANTNVTDGALVMKNLAWDEAGSINLKVTSTGYGGLISASSLKTGIFSPYKLVMKSNTWDYGTGFNFGYMGTEIGYEYKLEAQSANGLPTRNYGLMQPQSTSIFFAIVLKDQESGAFKGENLRATRILERLGIPKWGTDVNGTDPDNDSAIVTESGKITFEKLEVEVGATPLTTIEDGPYNSGNAAFGLAVNNVSYDVDFKPSADKKITVQDGATESTAEAFVTQPDIRYGRMALDSVSGPAGVALNIPLSVEYWNGSAFVISETDNGSTFKASNYCLDSSDNNVALQDSSGNTESKVELGVSSNLRAFQTAPRKENVRIFLRQGDSSPKGIDTCIGLTDYTQPWLQYNWRDQGDEDPSATVFFGQYRGSDRIIYRGE